MTAALRGFLGALILSLCASLAAAACTDGRVALRGPWGEARFSIALADTPRTRAQGLMFVETMPRSAGMLFVYPAPTRASFWMKNTLIPLDMVFADAAGVVQAVHHNATPGDLTNISGGDGILAVLEINGGMARALGITVGSELQHRVFSDGPAAWPC